MAHVDLKMVPQQGDRCHLHLAHASLCTSNGCIHKRRECARAARGSKRVRPGYAGRPLLQARVSAPVAYVDPRQAYPGSPPLSRR